MRVPNSEFQERIIIPFSHAEVTADTDVKLMKLPRKFRLRKATYINQTGLAQDATNVFAVQLLNDAGVAASVSSDSDQAGEDNSFTANEFLDLTIVEAFAVFVAGSVLSLRLDEGGIATLPPGQIIIEGTFL